MHHTTLGASGITIPRPLPGRHELLHQWVIGQDETEAVIARALELGVNLIDTANTYALTSEDVALLEEPYVAHELAGPIARPGEKPLAGTVAPPR